MKRLSYLIFLTLVLACGTDSHHFKIDGRLLNLNQGEFYVYSTDGLLQGVDTIHVNAGRFSYTTECDRAGTLVIVFPNFSEQPVFAEPGQTVSIDGDATHLNQITIKGTKTNKLMNQFREESVNSSPQEIRHYIELLVNDHPESPVGFYLVTKYFLQSEMPDYKGAMRLLTTMKKAQPDNGRLIQLLGQITNLSKTGQGQTIPSFRAVDVNGKTVSSADYMHGDAFIYVWSSWEFESANMQRLVKNRNKMKDMKVLGICLDMSKKECKKTLDRDDINSTVICDEQMFDGKLYQLLGFSYIPDNILLKNGKIVARNLTTIDMNQRFN